MVTFNNHGHCAKNSPGHASAVSTAELNSGNIRRTHMDNRSFHISGMEGSISTRADYSRQLQPQNTNDAGNANDFDRSPTSQSQ